MKANELMQGDLVLYEYNGKKIHARVVETYRSSALVESVSKEYEPIEIAEDKLFPIAITPEILEKNFQEVLPGINLMYQLKGPYCAMNEDGQWVFGLVKVAGENSARYPLVKISFVHELQHALRLCGIEKEIEL